MNPIQLRERLLFIRGKINLRRNINFYSWCLILIQYASWARYGIFFIYIPIGVQKPGSQYSPAIYTMDIAYKIDIPL